MRTNSSQTFYRVFSLLLFPLLFVVGIAIGVGQYRRVTNDQQHDIDRFYKMLAPIRNQGYESLVFSGPPGHLETLPQTRLVMVPCILRNSSEITESERPYADTSLVILPKELSGQLPSNRILWYAEDELYRYSLLVPVSL